MTNFPNTNESTVIEVNADEATSSVEMYEALQRLFGNADFNLVIEQGYFKDQPADLAAMVGNPSFDTPEARQNIFDSLQAIGNLHQYFIGLKYKAETMHKLLTQAEEERAANFAEDTGFPAEDV